MASGQPEHEAGPRYTNAFGDESVDAIAPATTAIVASNVFLIVVGLGLGQGLSEEETGEGYVKLMMMAKCQEGN